MVYKIFGEGRVVTCRGTGSPCAIWTDVALLCGPGQCPCPVDMARVREEKKNWLHFNANFNANLGLIKSCGSRGGS